MSFIDKIFFLICCISISISIFLIFSLFIPILLPLLLNKGKGFIINEERLSEIGIFNSGIVLFSPTYIILHSISKDWILFAIICFLLV